MPRYMEFVSQVCWVNRGERKTYVIRQATSVWKKSATKQRTLERKLPMRLQRAKTPRNRERMAKKRLMRVKANMKRVK